MKRLTKSIAAVLLAAAFVIPSLSLTGCDIDANQLINQLASELISDGSDSLSDDGAAFIDAVTPYAFAVSTSP